MKLKSFINQRFLEYMILILFLVMPFTNINHVCIYVILELICLYGIINYSHEKYDKVFIKYFIIYFIWCIIVTILSVNFRLSFQSLTSLLIPPLLLFSLVNSRVINKNIHNYLFVLSIILFVLSICIRAYSLSGYQDIWLFSFASRIGGGRMTNSTLSLCMMVYTMFFNQNLRNKTVIIGLNLIAGLVLKDNAFYFVLFLAGFMYWGLIKSKIAFYKLLIGLIIIVIALKFILINLLHHNLHVSERMNIYSYWLAKMFYSPIHGVGIGQKVVALFYTKKFPISNDIFATDPNIALHGHNYFLDLWLQAGVIGLVLMLLFFYKICRISYERSKKYGLTVFFMIFVIIMKNMVDDEINGSRGLIYWFFIVLTYASVLTLSRKQDTDGEL